MTLKERINADFIESFRAKDMAKKTFLGILKGEIQNEEGRGTVTTDESVLVIVKKMEKSLKTTNTPESLGEVEYIKTYLPTLMGEFNKSFKGLADNKLVSEIVKEVLS